MTTQKPDVNIESKPRDLGEVCNNQLQTAGKIGLVALAVGSVLAVGYLMGTKNKHPESVKDKNVTYVGNSQVHYFNHGPKHDAINLDVDKNDKRCVLLLEDFINSGYLADTADDSEDQMTRVLFYEHNNRFGESTPGKLSNKELDFVLQGCRQWVALPAEMKEETTFSKWYMNEFVQKYRAFIEEENGERQ